MKNVRSQVFACAFAALICAGAFISFPLPGSPVPIVVQNMFAILGGLVLGPFLGGEAVGIFLALGALGFPVFAGGKGGLAHLSGPTGGYLVGYLSAAIIGGLIANIGRMQGERREDRRRAFMFLQLIVSVIISIIIIYFLGTLRLKYYLSCSWERALALGVIPYIPGDILKAVAAILIAAKLRPVAAKLLDSGAEETTGTPR